MATPTQWNPDWTFEELSQAVVDTSPTVPDATEDGQALAQNQSGAQLQNLSLTDDLALDIMGAAQSAIDMRATDAISGRQRARVQFTNGHWQLQLLSDAGAVTSTPIIADPYGRVNLSGATAGVLVSDATADGQALAYGQTSAKVHNLDIASSGGSTIRFLRAGVADPLQVIQQASGNVDFHEINAPYARILGISATGGVPTLTVPAPADGATEVAAQVTAKDSTTGQLQIGGIEVGDTGWRRITSWDAAGTVSGEALDTSSTATIAPRPGNAGYIDVRRIGNVIRLRISNALGIVYAGNVNIWETYLLPNGFRAGADMLLWGVVGQTQPFQIANTGAILKSQYGNLGASFINLTEGSVSTIYVWPTSLPGTAV